MLEFYVQADPLVAFRYALRRSRVRAEILLVLLAFGRLSLADLARLVGAHPVNVHAAILGDGRRYRIADALGVLGLVDTLDVDGAAVFELTPIGRFVATALREQVERRRTGRILVRA